MRDIDGLFDVHSHILPSVDDGAKDWEMSKEMLTIAYSEGIRHVFVTPHYHKRYKNVSGAELLERFRDFKERVKTLGLPLEVYLGNELYYNQDAGELLEKGIVQTMTGSDYVLVEFSPMRDFSYIKNAVYHLQMEGYSPIIAHIERYKCLNKNLERIEQLVEMGIYLQVNANSMIGGSGFSTKQFLKKLLKYEYIHFIGTDAHNPDKRPPHMKKCAELIMKKCNEKYARTILFENPKKIIRNEYI